MYLIHLVNSAPKGIIWQVCVHLFPDFVFLGITSYTCWTYNIRKGLLVQNVGILQKLLLWMECLLGYGKPICHGVNSWRPMYLVHV